MKLSRRQFIEEAGAATAALALGRHLDPAAEPPMTAGASQAAYPEMSLAPPGQIIFGKDATAATIKANAAVLQQLPFANREEYALAQRGYIATLTDGVIMRADGAGSAWNLNDYAFLSEENAPATANPSLWRQAQLNRYNGLFEVVDRVYQVRGLDLANMTVIEGDSGLILVDPLGSAETARAAIALYRQERGERPVVAVIYTHTHADHWGGVKGVTSLEEVRAGQVQILAPEHFLEKAVSENLYAGTAMNRRSDYTYGRVLPVAERGQIDAGLGKAVSNGQITLIPPTDIIFRTGETRLIDGVELIFQVTPGAEAPAEMMIYCPQFRVFNAAELACMTLHNVYTLRGAEVRDANSWSSYLDEAIELFGSEADVVIAQHHWPRWGQDQVIAYLKRQRDLYKYIHDQTLRLANQGFTMREIGEMVKLPQSLSREWYCREYYGTLNHNVKAVYQKYLGWYDSNPATLNPLPPVEGDRKYVEYMGGEKTILKRARKDFAEGHYRWVAQVMNHLIFAEPNNREALLLGADALEQLGYQAESATWRNHYLQAAHELRNGVTPRVSGSTSPDAITAITLPMYFDFLGIRLDGPRAEGKKIVINWHFTDVGQRYALNLENCALTHRPDKQAPDADLSLTLTRALLDKITLGQTTFQQEMASGNITFVGNPLKLAELMGLLDTFEPAFNIVTP